MNISVVTVGKLKEKYLKAGIAEYAKRLGAYAKITEIEVADEKAPEQLSEADMAIVKKKEGERILAKIPQDGVCDRLEVDRHPAREREVGDAKRVTDAIGHFVGRCGWTWHHLDTAHEGADLCAREVRDRALEAAHQLGEEPGPVLPLESNLLVINDEGVTCHSSR